LVDALLRESDEEEEKVEAQKQIDIVTKQIASCDAGGTRSSETI
jgi:hypothetical protein